jgi:hypothetical protein
MLLNIERFYHTFICSTNGCGAGWLMVELLAASGVTINYSGDLDTEGMLIADRLELRFPDAVRLWRVDEQSYA